MEGQVYKKFIHLQLLFALFYFVLLNNVLPYHIKILRVYTNHSLIQVAGLSKMLNTHLDKGITADDDELSKRRSTFGSNTYPVKKGKTFWVILVFRDCLRLCRFLKLTHISAHVL